MSEDVKLLPCPFCGGKAVYLPPNGDFDFFAVSCEACAVGKDGETRDSVIESWNRRAPEPGTSVIRWARYDGTPETLPELGTVTVGVSAMCVVQRVACKYTIVANLYDDGDGYLLWDCGENGDSDAVEEGDLWTYLPDPPEGME